MTRALPLSIVRLALQLRKIGVKIQHTIPLSNRVAIGSKLSDILSKDAGLDWASKGDVVEGVSTIFSLDAAVPAG